MVYVLTTKNFSREIHNSQSLHHSWPSRSYPPPQWHPPSSVTFYYLETSPPTRSLPFWGLSCPEGPSSKPVAPTNISSMISADTYATLHSLTFITCNVFQCGQLWTVTDFLACNPSRPTPMTTAVTTNLARADCTITTVIQFRLHASIHIRYI